MHSQVPRVESMSLSFKLGSSLPPPPYLERRGGHRQRDEIDGVHRHRHRADALQSFAVADGEVERVRTGDEYGGDILHDGAAAVQ